jgi:hypothetical protein
MKGFRNEVMVTTASVTFLLVLLLIWFTILPTRCNKNRGASQGISYLIYVT